MVSHADSVSAREINPASQLILHAEPSYFLGNFRVSANQVRPHPSQRLLSQEWVDSLYQRFTNVGIDRAAHPIKLLLEKNQSLESLVASSAEAGTTAIPELPNNVVALVYHGQHRIAACRKMEDAKEHWWFAEVYRQGMYLRPH